MHLGKQRGFTLIEVMIAMALTAILVTGMVNLWAVVADQFFRLTMREKAIMAMNGEMERLNALYTFGQLAANTNTCLTTSTVSGSTYKIFDVSSNVNSEDGTTTCNATSMYATTDATFDYGQILGFTDTNSRKHNMVFLDKNKGVCGSFYWGVDITGSTDANISTFSGLVPQNTFCYYGGQYQGSSHNCALISLYMEFPYRYNSSTLQCDDTIGKKETISVKTIVGRRF